MKDIGDQKVAHGYDEKSAERLISNILSRNRFCTLATSSLDGKPEAAMMMFASDTNGSLVFYAFSNARKYKNIIDNPQASVVIYNFPDYLQMDGIISELSGDEAHLAKRLLIDKDDGHEYYHDDDRCIYFRFVPRWLKVRVDSNFPSKYFEFTR